MSLLRGVAKALFAGFDTFLRSPPGPRILIYHQVGVTRGLQMEVGEEDFEWQLEWLLANRRIVDLETAVRTWNEAGADQLVVLTFDDGYEDTFTTAFPHLREREIPFVLYLATQHIEEQSPLSGGAPLKWEAVCSMVDSGLVTIGAHTHTHRDLRKLSAEEIANEVSICDEIILKRTGVRPRDFAYPWGYWSPSADEVIRDRYLTAVLGAPTKTSDEVDAMLIHRFPVQRSDGTRWFRNRLVGGLLVEERVRRRLRGYEGP